MEALELTVRQRHRMEEQLKHTETARLFRRTLAFLERAWHPVGRLTSR